MIKKFYYILFLLLPVLAFVGCQDEVVYDEPADSAKVTLSYKVSLGDELETRAIGDGQKVNQLEVGVFQNNTLVTNATFKRSDDDKFPVELTLLKNKDYQIVFWAQAEGNEIYTLDENFNLSIGYAKYNNVSLVETESFEAFYACDEINLGNNKSVSKEIKLKRPFSQLNIAAKEEDVFGKVKSAEITVENLYTGFNLLTGEPTGDATKQSLTFLYSDADREEIQSIKIGEEDYYYVVSAYLFAPEKVKLTGALYDENDAVVKSFDFAEVELKPNFRTNIYGEMIQLEELQGWDGITFTEPEFKDNQYIIDEEADIAWLSVADNTANLSANATFLMTKDVLNMGNQEISSIQLPTGSTFDGNGKTIKHFANSLFGDATNITVKNLTLDDVAATSDSHVGVLVNTLTGSGTFTNVSISNSSATTTDGAAGGMIGYIVRQSEKDRSESLEVKLEGCNISQTILEATDNEGQFVGLLSGYDNGEKLTFTNCSATDDVVVPGTYHTFLGNETYCRGLVTIDDNRFMPKWDGARYVEPLLANPDYDGENAVKGDNKFVVYSCFDLAGVRKKTASPTAIYLKADIDMNGQGADGKYNVPSNFTQSAYASTDDNNFTPFNNVTTLDGMNHSIYNLSISQISQERAAFILYASGTTVHKNINFRNCQTVAVHKEVTTDAKAYGAILVSNVDATYTMENVHAYDCKVFALQKVGTLGARISGTSTLKNNSVNNCYVENYECKISERFTSGKKTISKWTVEVYADFYPHGEVGGMFGFMVRR